MMRRVARSLVSKLQKSPNPICKPLLKPLKNSEISSKSHLSTFSPSFNSIQFQNLIKTHRNFSSSSDYSGEIDEINLKFAEAREEIDAALDSKETVYFDEEAECAREATQIVLDKFEALLARLEEKERTALQRSMGLKIEQLKAELKQLEE